MSRPDDIQAERDHAPTVTLLRRVLGAEPPPAPPLDPEVVIREAERRDDRDRIITLIVAVLTAVILALVAMLSGCSSPVSTNTALILGGFGLAGTVTGWLVVRKIGRALSWLPGRRPERRGKGRS